MWKCQTFGRSFELNMCCGVEGDVVRAALHQRPWRNQPKKGHRNGKNVCRVSNKILKLKPIGRRENLLKMNMIWSDREFRFSHIQCVSSVCVSCFCCFFFSVVSCSNVWSLCTPCQCIRPLLTKRWKNHVHIYPTTTTTTNRLDFNGLRPCFDWNDDVIGYFKILFSFYFYDVSFLLFFSLSLHFISSFNRSL